MRRSRRAAAQWLSVLAAGVAAVCLADAPAARAVPSLDEAVEAIEGTPEAALALVRQRVAYRPYSGFLKGPLGTWWDGTGNAADAADLLLEVLRRKGVEGRLAFGTLPEKLVTAVLQGIFAPAKPPAEVQAQLPGDELADPVNDPKVRAIAARHVWVQAKQDERWIDLDPVVPGLKAGQAAAKATRTREAALPADRRLLRIDVLAKQAGKAEARRVLHFEQPVSAVVGQRMAFLNLGVDPKDRRQRLAPGLLQPALIIGEDLVEGEPYGGKPAGEELTPGGRIGNVFDNLDEEKKPKAPAPAPPELGEVVMEIALAGGGESERLQRRYLYLPGPDGLDRLDDLTAFCVGFGAPPARLVRQWAAEAAALAEKTRELKLPAAGDLTEEQTAGADALLGQGTGLAAMVALWLASGSHRMLGELDRAFGTLSDYGDARVLAVSVSPRREALSTDLVFDSARCWALPGAKASAPHVLGAVRGVLESDLEGAALATLRDKAELPGQGGVTVRSVFAAAAAAGIPLVGIAREHKAPFEKLSLPGHARRILAERIEAGRFVVVPERPVALAGGTVTAWYEVDRQTGEWVGVLGDGRHQAITEYRLTEKAVGFAVAYVGNYWGQYGLTLSRYAGTVVAVVSDETDQSWSEIRARALAEAAKPELMRVAGKVIWSEFTMLWTTPGEALLAFTLGVKGMIDGQGAALRFLTAQP